MRYNPHQSNKPAGKPAEKKLPNPVPAPEPITPACASLTIVASEQRLELRFAARPPAAMLDALAAGGWTWHNYHLAFVAKDTPEARASVEVFTKPTVPFTKPEASDRDAVTNIIPVMFTTSPEAKIPVTKQPQP